MSFPKNISESIESKFSKIAKKKDQKKIISLGLGEPDFKTQPNSSVFQNISWHH